MALGASRGDVIGMVLRMGLWLVGIGLAVGLGASLAANRVLASELWGVGARDPLTFAAVAVVVLGAGVAACWFPARRATRVIDPVTLESDLHTAGKHTPLEDGVLRIPGTQIEVPLHGIFED
jgi:hypothetical protein